MWFGFVGPCAGLEGGWVYVFVEWVGFRFCLMEPPVPPPVPEVHPEISAPVCEAAGCAPRALNLMRETRPAVRIT